MVSKDIFYNKLLSTADKDLPYNISKCTIENKSFKQSQLIENEQFTYLLVSGIGGREAKRL